MSQFTLVRVPEGDDKTHVVYLIHTPRPKGERDTYIGVTKRWPKRREEHLRNARRDNKGAGLLLRRVLRDALASGRPVTFEVLAEDLTRVEALRIEREIVAEFRPYLLNAVEGGHSARNPLPETRQAMSTAALGREKSASTCARLRQTTTTSWTNPDIRARRLRGMRERAYTPSAETRQAISDANKRTWADPARVAAREAKRAAAASTSEAAERRKAAARLRMENPELRGIFVASGVATRLARKS
jgi:predicted GIY-YIG superfamily endonuclease